MGKLVGAIGTSPRCLEQTNHHRALRIAVKISSNKNLVPTSLLLIAQCWTDCEPTLADEDPVDRDFGVASATSGNVTVFFLPVVVGV